MYITTTIPTIMKNSRKTQLCPFYGKRPFHFNIRIIIRRKKLIIDNEILYTN